MGVDVPLIRYTYASDYLTLLDAANVSYGAAARKAKLPLLVNDPADFVAKRPLWRFVDLAARAAVDPILGLHAGEFTVSGGYGATLADRACVAGPTLVDGVRAFIRLAVREANEFPAGTFECAGGLWLWQRGLTPTLQGPPGAEQMELFILGAMLGVIRRYLGAFWTPPVVHLQNQRRPRGLRRELSGARIVTGQRMLAVKIPAEVLGARRVKADNLASSTPPALEPPADLVGGLRQALTTAFLDAANSPITLDLAADIARVSPRTLQRRLADYGLHFRDLMSQSLAASAGRCLLQTDMPIAEIGHMHGYSDVTHFCRAFRRATSMSPGEYRLNQTESHSPRTPKRQHRR